MEGQREYLYAFNAAVWVRLGMDHLGKKASCPQFPLCLSLNLSINEKFFYMRLLSVLRYLHKANIVGKLQDEREGFNFILNKGRE